MMAEACCNRRPYRVAVFQPVYGIEFLFMAFSLFTRSLVALQSTRYLSGIYKDSRSFSSFRRTSFLPMAYPVSVSSNIDDTHCPAIGPFGVTVFNSFQSMAHDEPVVSPDWLQANLRMSDVKVLDASWYMPDEQRNPFLEYQVAHIPGALFFDVDGISDHTSDLPHMLPSEEAFAAAVSALGIQNKDFVVVYDGKGIFSSARVWWMFRVFGHDKVCVLDGGLPHWLTSGFDVESSASGDDVLKAWAAMEAIEMVYQQQPVVGSRTFVAKLQTHLIWTLEQVRENVDGETYQHVDARSKARFDGVAPEPRKGIRAGHVPGSKCLPFGQMLDESQKLLPKEVLLKKFEQEGISLDRPIVTSCGTGVTACILSLGLHRLGKTDVPVYDGSWTEWGSRLDTPIKTY